MQTLSEKAFQQIGKKCYDFFLIDKWKVKIFIINDECDINYILYELRNVQCNANCISQFIDTINEKSLNTGFTVSNKFLMQSVIIFGQHDSKSELINTIAHESRHLQQHIANVFHLNENSEDVCYLLGEIVQKIYIIFNKNHLI